jgi:anaerobic dimethyl sulfoxide reductase subunit B (iron-sulfur subunit)
MAIVFHFSPSRCSGCYTCVVACKDWHDIPAGPVFLRRLIVTETGRYPEVKGSFLSTACHHCATPACISACPAGAIAKREGDGIVVVDPEVCLGRDQCGGACLSACPFDAPQFGPERDARMQKCDLCLERWAEGRKPVCVEACPMRALDAGTEREMAAKYGMPC